MSCGEKLRRVDDRRLFGGRHVLNNRNATVLPRPVASGKAKRVRLSRFGTFTGASLKHLHPGASPAMLPRQRTRIHFSESNPFRGVTLICHATGATEGLAHRG